jgi:hypothetical protein
MSGQWYTGTMSSYDHFKAGVYKHYKGQHYMVYGLGHDSNYDDRAVVLYIGLELDSSHAGPRWAVRTYEDFYALVDPSTGEEVDKNFDGAVERFTFVGSTWQGND